LTVETVGGAIAETAPRTPKRGRRRTPLARVLPTARVELVMASVQTGQAPHADGSRERSALLIVEPNRLTRWSLRSYLRRWFDVECVNSAQRARRVLDARPVSALIVSDQLPATSRQGLATAARAANPALRTILTVTESHDVEPESATATLEKPFDLKQLAALLGVNEADDAASASP
jgi:hypothetical protein